MEEHKYFSDVIKNHFNKELVMTKKDNEDFENSTKCWVCNNDPMTKLIMSYQWKIETLCT